MEDFLSDEDQVLLLQLARQAMVNAVCGNPIVPLDLQSLPARLREPGVTFVTLTRFGELRGCIGALEPYQSLAEDVQEHAIAAALRDYRFPPVRPGELSDIKIEISRLTIPQDLVYESPEDLISKLHVNIDGVILMDGFRRATFLPQVWEKLPDPVIFLSHLCQKMGDAPDQWRRKKLRIQIYQVEEFHE